MLAPAHGHGQGGRAPSGSRSRSRERGEVEPSTVRERSPEDVHLNKLADKAAMEWKELGQKSFGLKAQVRIVQCELDEKRRLLNRLNAEVKARDLQRKKTAQRALAAFRNASPMQQNLPARRRLAPSVPEGGRAPIVGRDEAPEPDRGRLAEEGPEDEQELQPPAAGHREEVAAAAAPPSPPELRAEAAPGLADEPQ